MVLGKKEYFKQLLLLAIRILLGVIFIDYGYGKLTNNQFGLYDKSVLDQPLKSINAFQLSWYLFGLEQPFKYVIGILQIIVGSLMLFKKTFLIAALLYLPLILGIFLVNVSFVKIDVLTIRVMNYILLDIFLLYNNRSQILAAYYLLTAKILSGNKWNIKFYFIAFVIAIGVEFLMGLIVNALINLIQK